MKASALPFPSFLSFLQASGREPQIGRPVSLAHVPHDGRREPRARLLRPVEEFADLATKGMCPLGAPDERGTRTAGRSNRFRRLPRSNLLGCLFSASYDLEDVRYLPEGGAYLDQPLADFLRGRIGAGRRFQRPSQFVTFEKFL